MFPCCRSDEKYCSDGTAAAAGVNAMPLIPKHDIEGDFLLGGRMDVNRCFETAAADVRTAEIIIVRGGGRRKIMKTYRIILSDTYGRRTDDHMSSDI